MRQEQIDGWIIAYLEGSLGTEENRFVEEQLNHDPQWQRAYKGMQKTRQVPDDQVTFPWKSQLYKPEPRFTLNTGWKVAAAASILILAGLLWSPWQLLNNNRQMSDNALKKDSNIVKNNYSNSGNINKNLASISATLKKAEAGNAQKQTASKHNAEQKVEVSKSGIDRLKGENKKNTQFNQAKDHSELSRLPLKAEGELLKVEFEAPMVKNGINGAFKNNKMAFQTEKKNADTDQNRIRGSKEVQEKQSLLASLAEKVLKVDIKQGKGQNQKSKDRQSLRIETNPLAIRASIQFN